MSDRHKIKRRDKVAVYSGNDGKWYWRRTSGWNGMTIATGGQGYRNKAHAIRMAKKINRRATFTTEEH